MDGEIRYLKKSRISSFDDQPIFLIENIFYTMIMSRDILIRYNHSVKIDHGPSLKILKCILNEQYKKLINF